VGRQALDHRAVAADPRARVVALRGLRQQQVAHAIGAVPLGRAVHSASPSSGGSVSMNFAAAWSISCPSPTGMWSRSMPDLHVGGC
jgi:hypothetical protein